MTERKPNILLIILDTLRRDRLSAYGHTRETSPEFDAFAARATLFERAIAPAQWTVPSHGSMFTGLYPSAHQLTQANGVLSGAHPMLAEILHGAGYHTAAFCNNPLVGVLNNGLQRGFEHFYNYASAVPSRPTDAKKSLIRREFSLRFRPFARKVGNQFAQNDTMFRVSLHPMLTPIWTRYINFKGHTGNSIDDLIGYWGERRAGGQDQPMFAFLNLMGAHLPYQPPQDFVDRVAPGLKNDKAAYKFMRHFNADAAAWASPNDPPLLDWQRQTINDFYDAEIAHQDYHLGRLLRWLETSGALDDTYVIIAADHGEGHGDHEMFGHGFVVNQELIHVPLVIYGPERFKPGARVKTNVSTRRLFHTVLDLAGVEPPLDAADPNANVRGLSLYTAVNGYRGPEDGLAFSEAIPPTTFLGVIQHRNPPVIERLRLRRTRRGIYEGDHKLTMVGDQVEALYEVAADPAESRDVASANPAVTESLQRKMSAFAQSTDTGDEGASGEVSAAVEDQLRALGYIE
jgi:arylsulfatase A-like enzyme